jgi:hypothetical protein
MNDYVQEYNQVHTNLSQDTGIEPAISPLAGASASNKLSPGAIMTDLICRCGGRMLQDVACRWMLTE